MGSDDDQDVGVYRVVLNHEEQYSIWPEWKDIPNGWRAEGRTGTRAECLAYIDEVWTDMRPLSLRRRMEADAAAPAEGSGTGSVDSTSKGTQAHIARTSRRLPA